MKKKLTLHDLFQAKQEKRQLTEICTNDIWEAKACADAGIDIIMCMHDNLQAIRAVAPDTFIITADEVDNPHIANADAAVAAGFQCMKDGGDAVYTSLSLDCVRAMAREKIPTVGHVGYVPYRSSWVGGPRAIGKTAPEAIQVYQDTLAYQEAGAIAMEIEIVPHQVATEIAKRLDILIISMGSGTGGIIQYLFATDILGTNTGHVPRHAKIYGKLHQELQRIQQLCGDALQAFHQETTTGIYPEPKHLLEIKDQEFNDLLKGIDSLLSVQNRGTSV